MRIEESILLHCLYEAETTFLKWTFETRLYYF
ncbi:hypothetical protein Gotri_022423 [Gossypium trilobum]|uniref:Uncharacterized protein n=1 Tax=Gossypium trilobum TaxID=34281 RepID=A0A7J9DGH3_9ROSI|nr:hypothetical protein [Gossypium trilobum]